MAALDAITRLLKPGDHVIAGDDLDGGKTRLLYGCHSTPCRHYRSRLSPPSRRGRQDRHGSPREPYKPSPQNRRHRTDSSRRSQSLSRGPRRCRQYYDEPLPPAATRTRSRHSLRQRHKVPQRAPRPHGWCSQLQPRGCRKGGCVFPPNALADFVQSLTSLNRNSRSRSMQWAMPSRHSTRSSSYDQNARHPYGPAAGHGDNCRVVSAPPRFQGALHGAAGAPTKGDPRPAREWAGRRAQLHHERVVSDAFVGHQRQLWCGQLVHQYALCHVVGPLLLLPLWFSR